MHALQLQDSAMVTTKLQKRSQLLVTSSKKNPTSCLLVNSKES